jgi:hypothetical protein
VWPSCRSLSASARSRRRFRSSTPSCSEVSRSVTLTG